MWSVSESFFVIQTCTQAQCVHPPPPTHTPPHRCCPHFVRPGPQTAALASPKTWSHMSVHSTLKLSDLVTHVRALNFEIE